MGKKLLIAAVIVTVAFAGGWLYAARDTGESIQVVMYQNPACGCCGKWAAYMERNGFTVEINKTNEVNRIKEREGITAETASCHTAFIDGYVVEGHVPVADIRRLLKDRPDAVGITTPGMPMGSPGMEGDWKDDYDVLLMHTDGSTSVYASH